MAARPPLTICVLGAESTGKTRLTQEMASRLRAQGDRVAVVPEVLRAWCEQAGRAPRPDEWEAIAREQERQVDAALTTADIVLADTSALVVAVYGALLFEDHPLLQFARERQRGYDLMLLTGLDVPWTADGLQRAGPQAREATDAVLREQLQRAGVDWRMVYGTGPHRCANALEAVASVAPWAWRPADAPPARWRGVCDACSDPDCEHRLFTGLAARPLS
ncbi:ATP-binding protein [Ramlibacter sp. AN1015]|uniref:ATP-binding protein n=1 Tax=Ramlibacter sp. AN1015 TaxID=3133428 RepID=UPI0030BB0BBF